MKNALPHNKAEQSALDSLKFTAPHSSAQLLVLKVLINETLTREEVDSIGGVSNGPELISKLRALGLGKEHLPCEIKTRLDQWQRRIKRYGEYSLTPLGKKTVRRALGGLDK